MSATDGTSTIKPSVVTYMPFLARDKLYKVEKPYGADFPVDEIEDAKIANHIFDIKPVQIHDVRHRPEPFNLEEHGFCFIKAKTALQAQDCSIERTPAMESYSREIVNILHKHLPQYMEIQFMDFQVRKRSVSFPSGHGEKVDYAQPATMPHTDFSGQGARLRMKDVFPGQEDHYRDRQFDLINVWRVLKGPNNDWPLAVCDFSSIDVENDTTANDALHLTRTGENWLIHHSDIHRWYFMSSMEDDDLIVFRNTDCEEKLSRCFHAAFNNPGFVDPPRESVEVRLVAFRN